MRPAHLRAGMRVLARHLRYAGADPRKWLWVLRRGAALAGEGALAGVLERHLDDDQLYSDYAAWCERYEEPAAAAAAARVAVCASPPLVSILLPVHDVGVEFLEAALRSVRQQRYTHWELCVVDDASRNPEIAATLARHGADDPRIRVARRRENGGIAHATNEALAMARGELCAFLDHDDCLAPDALLWVAAASQDDPRAVLFFSDEDKLDAAGRRTRPFFKPDWDGEWIRTTNCVLHFMVARTQFVRDLGGIALGVDGAQDWDLVLRIAEAAGRDRIVHVPRVLYHWREIPGSTAAAAFEKPALVAAQSRVIAEAMRRRGERGHAMHTTQGWRIEFAVPEPAPLVSIVIPTRDRWSLLAKCVESIRSKSTYPSYELVIVDNESRERDAVDGLAALAASGAARVVGYPHPFNYAAQCNLGVQHARGQVVALLNNDIEVTAAAWLEELVSLACRPGIGLAGATLFYPNGTLQHAGVILGLNGVGDRPWIGTRHGYAGPYGRARSAREVSALITACAVVLRDRYLEVGGMNESLAVSCNDLDLCLRLSRAGYRHVVSPYAELVHHESASRGYADNPANERLSREEEDQFAAQWQSELAGDPLYNPNLTLSGRAYALAWPPRIAGLA